MKKAVKSGLLAAMAISLLNACGGDEPPDEIDDPPPPAPQTFTVGGSTTGLTGSGLVLRNNAGDDLAIAANGSFTFAQPLPAGAAYTVSIRSQPTGPDQVCSVTGGAGNIAAANVTTVSVTCAAPPPASFTIGGTVTGLNGTLVLQNGGGADLTLTANGAFMFGGTVTSGAAYDVTVRTQPGSPPQVCRVTNGNGIVSGANVSNIAVACTEFLTVTGSAPANAATAAARDTGITVQFSANLDPATVNTGTISLERAGANQEITVLSADNVLTVRPTNKLLPLTLYTLTITPALQGAAGQSLAGIVTLNFTTRDGQWGAPQLVQSMNSIAMSPRIALDAEGNGLAVWMQNDAGAQKVWSNRYVSGWGTATVASPDAAQVASVRLGVDARGNAVAVWSEFESGQLLAMAARYEVGTGWGPELLLSGGAAALYPEVAVDATGNAMVVWEELDGPVNTTWSRRYAINSGWSSGQSLDSSSLPNNSGGMAPMVATDQDGNAMVTYRKAVGIFWDLWAQRYVADSGWEPATLIETEQSSVNLAPIAFDRFGNAFVVWTQGTANFGHASIWSNRYVDGTGWGTATLLETNTIAPGQMPSVAVDGQGNAIAVWQHSDLSRAATDIWANRYVMGTGWGAERLIETQFLRDANFAKVVMDTSGNAIALWKEHDGTQYRLWTNRYVPGSGWSIASRLEPVTGEIFDSDIAVDAQGNAIAIWSRNDANAGGLRVYASRFE